MAAPMNETDGEADKFKEKFKYYKRRQPPPDLSEVVDFNDKSFDKVQQVSIEKIGKPIHTQSLHRPIVGLQPVDQWKVHVHQDLPGLIFISNPFMPGFQKYWVSQCLSEYPRKPNITNLDVHMKLDHDESVWEKSSRERKTDEDSFKETLVHKLRWTTLGFHHDWDTKKYSSKCFTKFPTDLSVLTQYVARTLGHHEFKAEAAIVNYYHMDSTLGGHTDHSEPNNEAPLFSFSFGQTAIFLLGGKTKAMDPVAMYVRSGDIMVMSGTSRLSYHGVPKILSSTNSLCDVEDNHKELVSLISSANSECSCDHCGEVTEVNKDILKTLEDMEWKMFEIYLRTSRINMNVRQVLKVGQISLDENEMTHSKDTPPGKKAKLTDK